MRECPSVTTPVSHACLQMCLPTASQEERGRNGDRRRARTDCKMEDGETTEIILGPACPRNARGKMVFFQVASCLPGLSL